MFSIDRIDHLVLTVRDIPTTCDFYRRVLSFEPVCKDGRWSLLFGRLKMNVHQQGHEFDPKAALPTPGSADSCFISDTDTSDVVRNLTSENVAIEKGPTKRRGALGTMTSVYRRDPDGNLIEIAKY